MELDSGHKVAPSPELYEAIQQVTNALKCIDSRDTAKDVMYATRVCLHTGINQASILLGF